ncbi:MAG: 3-ketoacyl-ACP reductase [Nitrososphaerota archaeon]|nr:3-ketoacyl-ACP reductase [Candidatus Bathyarchaeota archaeon]MDW8049137.1 3-ketoacyl-ACP reductase [Nitrososphaerota archaeon]
MEDARITDGVWNSRPVALITGAARGIGAAIAVELARNGFDIAVNDICEPEQASQVLDGIKAAGCKAIFIRADISIKEDRERMLSTMKSSFGRIDILVNNAGIAPKVRADILEASEESFDQVLAVNLKGPYFLTQIIARWMIELKQQKADLDPKIINISSISAYTSSINRGEYCISKAGLSMMTKLYADRLAEYGINVYEIRPGIILTHMTEPVKEKYDRLISEGITPIKRWGKPEDVAKAVVAIAKGYFPFSTGEVFNVDGGFHLKRL